MTVCRVCRTSVPSGARFCPACGAATSIPEADADRTTPADSPTVATPPSSHPRRPPSSSAPFDGARYAPGTFLAGRYRLVALLGRGGMGEVYRADDLTLGQPVALKFLPAAIARDPDRLRRFFQEVRVAREVSHPNVCRVYDVGETDGHAYLSMEYIDGEDLASLLRRIGRLPREKGVEIARQLCAGLAAIHERGVVHRDLKPANVMLDGRGRVRLTDFGLAALASEVVGPEARAGTPAYMAPEQLRGERVDVRSDVFALGLVLYEIFTGKRAFDGDTPADIARLHRDSTPRSPSTILPDIDPAIERVIAHCLEKDAASRPSSALAVAAALPGGDPLAAALAAGEIPSIELVAAAGVRGSVRPWVGIACLLAVLTGVVVAARYNALGRLYTLDPMEKPPAVLEDRAREILAKLGHEPPVEDTAIGFEEDSQVLKWISKNDSTAARWETLRDARPAGVAFWYRQSPKQMIAFNKERGVDWEDPPQSVAGMARLQLDTRGRLLTLEVAPPERGTWEATASDSAVVAMPPAPAVEPDWHPLLEVAGLDLTRLERVAPEWAPPVYVDTRAAWRGTYPDHASMPILVEAGAFAGRPTWFAIYGPWSQPEEVTRRERTTSDRVIEAVLLTGIVGILIASLVLGLRNVRLGRGDRAGARRISLFTIATVLVGWLLSNSHSPDPQEEINLFFAIMGPCLWIAGMVWAFYLALEPYVRKTWPERIIGWSRVLTGRLGDPLVGRDVLVGGLWFAANTLLDAALRLIAAARGTAPPRPEIGLTGAFLGTPDALAVVMNSVLNAIFQSMFLLVLLLLLRLLVRRANIAAVIYVALFAVLAADTGHGWERIVGGAVGAAKGAVTLFVLVRFGLLSYMVGRFFALLVSWFPLTLDSSKWYSGNSTLAIFILLAMTAYGLVLAIRRPASSGRPAA